ncbi:MAG: BatA domain-containing protein [bacterium]|nr:BatA domain-containing protein [bacterium]
MNFLIPNFLFWLFALPIPFLIHLWHKKTTRRVLFSSTMFFQQSEQGKQSFKKPKDILLLILRTLILLFIILGFANPVLNKKQNTVMLDDSYDMLTKSGKSTIFELGLKEAHKIKGAKLVFASGTKYNEYPKATPSAKFRRFALQSKTDTTQEYPDYIITKLGKISKLPNVKLVEIDGRDDNFSIDSLLIENSKLFVKITNHTSKTAEKLITLFTKGTTDKDTLSAKISIPANSNTITLFPLPEKAKYGYLQIESDALDIDNIRYFVVPSMPSLKVLITGDTLNSFFIENALAPPGGNSKITLSISVTQASLPTGQAGSLKDISSNLPNNTDANNCDVIIFNGNSISQIPHTIFAPSDAPLVKSGFLRLTALTETHPLFDDKDIITEFKQARFTRVAQLDSNLLRSSKILARFSNNSPAIVELENGNLWLAFPLNQYSDDFIVSPSFVLFMQRIVYWMAGKQIQKHNFIVGEKASCKVEKSGTYLCKYISGGQNKDFRLNSKIEADGIYVNLPTEIPGIYELQGTTDAMFFAVNISNEIALPSSAIDLSKNYVLIRNWFFWLALVLMGLEMIIKTYLKI